MNICLRNNYARIIFAHWYNNLFSKRFFSDHIEFQFILLFIIVGNIVYFDNCAKRQTRKCILNFENILNITFSSLSK